VYSDHAEHVVGAKEGNELFGDTSREVSAWVRGNLVISSVGEEEGEQGLSQKLVKWLTMTSTMEGGLMVSCLSIPLADWAPRDEVDDLPVVDGVTRV
jgi:hypothetical protein